MDLQFQVLDIIKRYKYEILRDRDWWYGLSEHDVNVFQEDGRFIVSIYKMGSDGSFDYNSWENMPSLTFSQILCL